VADFLQARLEGLAGPLIVVWDRGGPHSGDALRALLVRMAPRLDIEPLPLHAPELMPVEVLWRWLKYDRLCNFAPRDAHHLNEAVVRELEANRADQELLRAFFHLSDLSIPRALLS
jgi:transposase